MSQIVSAFRFPSPMLCRIWIFLLFLWPSVLLAELVNVTVDDSFVGPDPHQATISYSPADQWQDAAQCTLCHAAPDTTGVYNNSFHHTTADSLDDTAPTFFTFNFNGTGVYVYCVLANNLGNNTGTRADYSFTLDNQPVGRFIHNPDPTTSNYQYGVAVYANSTIPSGQHTLIATVNAGAGITGSSLMLLDYVTYTYDDGVLTTQANQTFQPTNTPSSTSGPEAGASKKTSIGAIIGGAVVGGLLLISAILLVLWFLRRRSRKAASEYEDYHKPDPFLSQPHPSPIFQPLLASKRGIPIPSPPSTPPFVPVSSKRRLNNGTYSPYTPNTSGSSSSRDTELVEVENRLHEMEQAIANLTNNLVPSTSSASTSSQPTQPNVAVQKQILSLQNQLAGLREQQRVLVVESQPPEYREV